MYKYIKASVSIAILVTIAVVVGFSSFFLTGKPDQVVEEIAEDVIENQLGLPDGAIDFTPDNDN